MSLGDALAYALAHQPQIRAARARLEAERVQAEVPRSQWLPAVGVSAQLLGGTANNTTGSYVAPDYLDIPRIGATRAATMDSASLRPYASTLAAAGVTQELFDFGRIAAAAAAADALIEVRSHEADAERLDVEFNVEESFFAVAAAHAVLSASEGAYQRSKAHRDLAQAGVDSGLRSPIELTRAEADLERFDIGRIRARGGVSMAQTGLAAAIGSDEPAIDAAQVPGTVANLPEIGAAIERASQRDPALQESLTRLKAEELNTHAIGAELRPDISLTGTVSMRAGGAPPSSGERAELNGWLPTVPNWSAGVLLNWPLFDGTISARESASRAREQMRREEIASVRQQLVATVRERYVSVQVARDALPGLQRAVDAALANYAQADARFKAGLGTSVELADAEALRASTEIDLAIGTFELAKARAAFGRAIAEGL